MTTSAADTPLTWPQLAALDWARSGGFTLDIDGEPLRAEAVLRHGFEGHAGYAQAQVCVSVLATVTNYCL